MATEDKDSKEGKGKGASSAQAAAATPAKDEQQYQFEGYLAEIVEVIKGRTGIYGEVRQVMCKIIDGQDKGRVIRRNLTGKVRVGDFQRLPDTSREAKQIRAR